MEKTFYETNKKYLSLVGKLREIKRCDLLTEVITIIGEAMLYQIGECHKLLEEKDVKSK